jgi:hypothetical protein
MAFTFTVETGSGLVPTANSYTSVEEADDILTMNIHMTGTWDQLSSSVKERLLAWSTRYLDERTRWFGYKTIETSPLRWPRTRIFDRDDVLIGDNTIPHQLKVATAEMARYLIAEDRSAERDQDSLKRLKADVIELDFIEGYQLPAVPASLKYLIQGLGTISSGSGVKFARIIR